ncbi:UdgX family uracil-DNA binding protein [Opitutus terrae]|uniref:Type-4 uracil-DNA glycosylase n=1 Tax=Opitutus terrae (strain DSM 11246 / JCM 15787 / PB90-1) TaxID=452637 RepID=B1ZZZ0_OPITP|nr:UdgX family uracil-DNA binding protein [Opitutus terrae]ACB77326.1 phage SPO1 DNA polymerase-related protein [Opitutus terrae PB90-1]
MSTATGRTLEKVRAQARDCTRCPLYKTGTQTVFGEGRVGARMLMVGEQPGDQEDIAGRPFVGPAGQLLNRALEEAGIDRDEVFVTNAVKHFKWVRAGKRRLHKKPNAAEINACRPWLEAELELVQPDLIVALGATAAQTLMGRQFRVTQQHGQVLAAPCAKGFLATIHPSAVLRTPPPDRDAAYAGLVSDLKAAVRFLKRSR